MNQNLVNDNNQAVIDLFLSELKAQEQSLTSNFAPFETGTYTVTNVESLIGAIHKIKGASSINRFDLISNLTQSLENYFKAIISKTLQFQNTHLSSLKEAIDWLNQIGKQSGLDFAKYLKNNETQIDKLSLAISNFINKALPKEPKINLDVPKDIENEVSVTEDAPFNKMMSDLFQVELETQCSILSNGLVLLEQGTQDPTLLETLMRAAHSIKGAAKAIRMDPIVGLAHAMEDYFVALQEKKIEIEETSIDIILRGVDFLSKIIHISFLELDTWLKQEKESIRDLHNAMIQILSPSTLSESDRKSLLGKKSLFTQGDLEKAQKRIIEASEEKKKSSKTLDRVLRVTAQNLNRLMGLAGESLLESNWLIPFRDNLLKQKKMLSDLANHLDLFNESVGDRDLGEWGEHYLVDIKYDAAKCQQNISDRLVDFDMYISRHSSLSDRLYREVINSRMRPFSDSVQGFPRMVRDLAKQLGKKIRLEISGQSTPVDREILERLEAPLSHLIRNAVDHGIEDPKTRVALGKPPEGVIHLDAQHRAGMLSITVSDDGAGIDVAELRNKIVEKNLAKLDLAQDLSEAELFDFLFLPGFTTSNTVTEISGRGVGLSVVQNMVQEVSGSIRTFSEKGRGISIHLQLPLTLSVIRALVVEISGEPYAFPLTRIERSLIVLQSEIKFIENRQYFSYEGKNIGLISASQVLELEQFIQPTETFSVIILSDRVNQYGLVVDRFLGGRELVVQELDPRLGKLPDISAGAFMEDGSPVFIIDVEDIVRSIDILLSGGRVSHLNYEKQEVQNFQKKRILVVDDSLTVREVECRLLRNQGYEVDTAVNGMDGWNAVRLGNYDLVITDVDMPRMNGIELVKSIKKEARLKSLPVMIVSYKERGEDRALGIQAGADYYLTKSSFHDDTLLHAVYDLIGRA